MREALSGLTVRGRAFLAAGVTAAVCAVLLDQRPLGRVGVLLVALPLLAAWVLARTRYRLSLVREVVPHQVVVGQPARVSLTLTNDGRTPSGLLLLEEQVPYELGARPRFVLEGIGHGWSRHATYQVRADLRGRFEVGPMSVRVTDPFGLLELGRAFRSTATLTVVPRTVPLPAIPLGQGWTGSGDERLRAAATGSAEDVTVRTYRRGDDLRRVHWRSSARTGELMVRREEQPWQARATVFLDDRVVSHRGAGPTSSFETAVSAAASVATHLARRGYTVRLVTATGEDPATARLGDRQGPDAAALLESLAVLRLHAAVRLDQTWLSDHAAGVTVAVLGLLQAADAPVLRRMAHPGLSLALALDLDAWGSGPRGPGGPATPVLLHQGWRVSALGPGDTAAQAWQELGRGGSRPAPGRASARAVRDVTAAAGPGRTPGETPS